MDRIAYLKEKAFEKRLIKKAIKEWIDMGKPKQQILEDLSLLYKDKVTILKQLEFTPSKVMKHKYRLFNYMLAVLLLAATILDVIILKNLNWGKHSILDVNYALSVALDAIFLVGVLLYRIEIYSWVASRAVVSLVTIMVTLYYQSFAEINSLIFISLTLIVVFFILGLFLGIKLCPPRVPKVIEVPVNGTEKINKIVYVFQD